MMLSSSSRATATLSCAVATAISTSPAAIAVNARLNRFHASACALSSTRAPSIAPSKTSADSAIRPCTHSAVPSIGKISGKRSPCPVARPIASAARSWRPEASKRSRYISEVVEVDERVEAAGELVVPEVVDQPRRVVAYAFASVASPV